MYNENEVVEEQNGISFGEIFFALKRNIIKIIIVTLIFGIIGAVYGFGFKKTKFSATATTVIQVDSAGLSEYNGLVYGVNLSNSMKDFIVSDAVVTKVAQEYLVTKYKYTEVLDGDDLKYHSSIANETISKKEFETKIRALASDIQGNTSIKTSTQNLILKITYTSLEEQKTLDIINLLVSKTKEVALTQKDTEISYSYPEGILVDTATEAYKKAYDLEEEKDENGKVTGYTSTNGSLTVDEFEVKVNETVAKIKKSLVIYRFSGSVIVGIDYDRFGTDENELIANCVVLLSEYAKEGKLDYNEKPSTNGEYLYPTFANKLVELSMPTVATAKRGATLVIVIALFIGFAVICSYVVIAYLMDDTYTSKEDIEKLTGKPVLSMINDLNKKESK